jgi:hypothetical protein
MTVPRKFTIEVMVDENGDLGYQIVITADSEPEYSAGPVVLMDGLSLPVGRDPINPDLVDLLGDGEVEFLDHNVTGDHKEMTLGEVWQEVEMWISETRNHQLP